MYVSSQVTVFDNVFTAGERDQLFLYVNKQEFRSVHVPVWQKVWRLGDGAPLVGPTWNSDRLREDGSLTDPSEAVGIFFRRVLSLLAEAESVTKMRRDWTTLSATPWIYPVGAGLSLHVDGKSRLAGAYAYFLHQDWNIHWGGQLIVLDPASPNTFDTSTDQSLARGSRWLVDDVENERVWEPGLGLCIFPKPNRIVFISPTAQHFITRVDSAAGQNARLSIAGFLLEAK